MRIHPKIYYIVEEAEGFVWIRRQQRTVKGRSRAVLPGGGYWLMSRLQAKAPKIMGPACAASMTLSDQR